MMYFIHFQQVFTMCHHLKTCVNLQLCHTCSCIWAWFANGSIMSHTWPEFDALISLLAPGFFWIYFFIKQPIKIWTEKVSHTWHKNALLVDLVWWVDFRYLDKTSMRKYHHPKPLKTKNAHPNTKVSGISYIGILSMLLRPHTKSIPFKSYFDTW